MRNHHLNFVLCQRELNSLVLSAYVVTVNSTVEISQNFVAFSEYMNFNLFCTLDGLKILCHQIIKKLSKIAKALQLKIAQKIHAKTY